MPTLPAITSRFRGQRGLITRQQALESGLTHSMIDHHVRSGRWEVLHPSVYRLAGAPRTWHQEALGATLWLRHRGSACISHVAGLFLWGVSDQPRRPSIELVVDHATRPRDDTLLVHRTRYLPSHHVRFRLGIAVTSVERTLADCARSLSRGRLERAVEDAIRLRLTTVRSLDEVVADLSTRRWPRIGVLRTILDERRPGGDGAADRELELAAWRLICASGLVLPVRQHVVTVDGIEWAVDFAWPDHRVALETDGYSSHQGLTAFRQDRRKLRALASVGYTVLPATWIDVTQRATELIVDIDRALRRAA